MLATEACTAYSAEIGSNLGMAITLSLALILLSMGFVFIQRVMSRQNVYHSNPINPPEKVRLRGFANIAAHAVVYFIALGGAIRRSSLVLYVAGTVTMPVKIDIAINDGGYGTAASPSTLLLSGAAVSCSEADIANYLAASRVRPRSLPDRGCVASHRCRSDILPLLADRGPAARYRDMPGWRGPARYDVTTVEPGQSHHVLGAHNVRQHPVA